jgi:HrpA-like RNA helicase
LTTDAQEVLRQLISNILPDYLILDEVHTYTVDIEILLALMKQNIAENPDTKTKYVIMTATLDRKLILNYLNDIVKDIPYFDVP